LPNIFHLLDDRFSLQISRYTSEVNYIIGLAVPVGKVVFPKEVFTRNFDLNYQTECPIQICPNLFQVCCLLWLYFWQVIGCIEKIGPSWMQITESCQKMHYTNIFYKHMKIRNQSRLCLAIYGFEAHI